MSSSSIHIKEVKSPEDKKQFLNVVQEIYRNDKSYIRPLNADITSLCFDKENVTNWIALHDGKCLGRISGFYNEHFSESFEVKTGGIGFYESIDDLAVSELLFSKAISYLKDKYRIEAINGPINNEINFRYWGLLIDNYNPPFFGQAYNPTYYKSQFEQYGFQAYYEQYFYESHTFEIPSKWKSISARFQQNPDYDVRSLTKDEIDIAPQYFLKVYNEAWKEFPNFKPLTEQDVQVIFKELKPILDPDIICFAFYKNEPVAMIGLLPDVNQILQHIKNGQLGLVSKLKFAWHKMSGTMNKAMGFVYGVHPKFQRLGINAYLSHFLSETLQTSKYDKMEMAWIGSFNPKMLQFMKQLPVDIYNTGCVYRLHLDKNVPFERKANIL